MNSGNHSAAHISIIIKMGLNFIQSLSIVGITIINVVEKNGSCAKGFANTFLSNLYPDCMSELALAECMGSLKRSLYI